MIILYNSSIIFNENRNTSIIGGAFFFHKIEVMFYTSEHEKYCTPFLADFKLWSVLGCITSYASRILDKGAPNAEIFAYTALAPGILSTHSTHDLLC